MFDTINLNLIKDQLITREETIAAAESVTGGLLQLALSSVESAEMFFQGGITTYNIGQKSLHLNINPIHALKCNCVSENIVKDMAINVCRLFNSDWGLAVTGYATPVEESDNKQYVWIGIAYKGEIRKTRLINSHDQGLEAQKLYVESLLSGILDLLSERSL